MVIIVVMNDHDITYDWCKALLRVFLQDPTKGYIPEE